MSETFVQIGARGKTKNAKNENGDSFTSHGLTLIDDVVQSWADHWTYGFHRQLVDIHLLYFQKGS